MTKMTMKDLVARAIHEGLGGNGWAYTNYGGNEWETERDILDAAADAAMAIVFEAAAKIAETPDRTDREWVPDSLWANISCDTAARIRRASRDAALSEGTSHE